MGRKDLSYQQEVEQQAVGWPWSSVLPLGGKQHGNIRGSSGCVSQGGWWHNWQTCTPPEAQAL